jgi:hypothetical protein
LRPATSAAELIGKRFAGADLPGFQDEPGFCSSGCQTYILPLLRATAAGGERDADHGPPTGFLNA